MLVRPGLSHLTHLPWADSLSERATSGHLKLIPRTRSLQHSSLGALEGYWGLPRDQSDRRMVLVALLGLSWFCSPLGALVLDFNNIKSSMDVQGTGKVSAARAKQY